MDRERNCAEEVRLRASGLRLEAAVSVYFVTQYSPFASKLQRGATPIFSLGAAFRFQFRQQLLNTILLLERGEPVFDVVGGNLPFGLAHCLGMRHFALHPVECRDLRAVTPPPPPPPFPPPPPPPPTTPHHPH